MARTPEYARVPVNGLSADLNWSNQIKISNLHTLGFSEFPAVFKDPAANTWMTIRNEWRTTNEAPFIVCSSVHHPPRHQTQHCQQPKNHFKTWITLTKRRRDGNGMAPNHRSCSIHSLLCMLDESRFACTNQIKMLVERCCYYVNSLHEFNSWSSVGLSVKKSKWKLAGRLDGGNRNKKVLLLSGAWHFLNAKLPQIHHFNF